MNKYPTAVLNLELVPGPSCQVLDMLGHRLWASSVYAFASDDVTYDESQAEAEHTPLCMPEIVTPI